MIDLSKAFPERTARNIARVAGERARTSLLHDPFGLATKSVHVHFNDGDRVRVNSPEHYLHACGGVIENAHSDNGIHVKLDNGYLIRVPEWELVPEEFSVANGGGSHADPAPVSRVHKSVSRNPMEVEDEPSTLEKRAKSAFSVGQRVSSRRLGKPGVVTGVRESGLVEIRYDDGGFGYTTQDMLTAG